MTVQTGWASFKRSWIITRREVRDTIRDWRLMVPIALLTLVFPALMQFTAAVAQRWVMRWGGEIIGERLIPFLLMIVGFFPISFSLVIALETFVGEKERKSLEPLLATPLTNWELYWGKTMAAMIPPLCASYLGLAVYLLGLFFGIGWTPSWMLLVQVILLTTAEALVMVSGAVVVSSQTTSVRAANILASFIIIPMTLLVQAESAIMFWARYHILWWFIAALLAINLVLVRMGIRIFNREELLGRDIDELNIVKAWRYFWNFFKHCPPELGGTDKPFSLGRVYRHDIPLILDRNLAPISIVLVVLVLAFFVGWGYAIKFPLPEGAISLDVPEDAFKDVPNVGFLPSFNVWGIMFHNLRVLVLEAFLGLFSFGSIALVLLMIPIAVIGVFAGQMPMMGASPLLFLATFILPHGIIEMPAAIIATGLALRLGAAVVSPPPGMTLSQGVLMTLADFAKLMVFLIIPMLIVAAMLEVWLTPWIVVQVW
ncbi:MAG: stage II sporulation protein M [Anaerolineae bacterium]|nr:stage II sporulation protein M [Anaerolineae bacterium]